MTKQIINTGTAANSKTGDSLRTAFTKINQNFTELYSAIGADVQIPIQTGNAGKVLTTNGTTLSWTNASTDRITSGSHSVVNDGSGALVLNDVQYIYAGADGKDIDIYTHSNNSSELWLKDNGPAEIITNGGDYIWTFGKDGKLTLPNISTIDASVAQVGYSYGPYDIDIYYNTTGGALDSGHLTIIDIGATAHNNLFNAPIAPRSTITGTIAANGNFTPGTPTVGTFTRFNLIRVGGVNIGSLQYRDEANPSAGLRIGYAGSPYTGPTVTAGTVIEGWSGRQTVAPKITTYIRWADGSSTQVTGSQVRYPGEDYASVVTTDNVSGKHFPATLYTANYSAATTAIGMNTKQWQFDGNGTLTFPNQTTFGRNNAGDYLLASLNDLVLKSKKSVTISSGEDIGALHTSYTNSLVPLGNLMAASLFDTSFFPASHTTYAAFLAANEINPLISDELVALAKTASDAWNAWQAVLNSSAVTIGIGDKGWHFGTDGTLTLPDGSGVAGGFIYGATGSAGGITNGGTGYQQFFAQGDGAYVQTSVGNAGTVFNTWTFGLDGSLTLPHGAGFGYGENGQLKVNDGVTLSLDLRDSSGRGFYTNSDGYTLRSNGSYSWTFGSDAILSLPQNLSVGAAVIQPNASTFGLKFISNGNIWAFGTDGNLTLPVGGLIKNSDGTTYGGGGSADRLTNGSKTVVLGSTGTLTLANGTTISDQQVNLTKGPALNSFGSNSYTGIFTTLIYTGLDTTWVVNGPGVVNGTIQSIDAAGQTIILTRGVGSPQFQNGQSYTFTGPLVSVGTKLTVNSNNWQFGTNGGLTLPGYVTSQTGLPLNLSSSAGSNATFSNSSGSKSLVINDTNLLLVNEANTWTFDSNGRTTFPATTVPAHSYGVAGDKVGMVAFDGNYIYYCKQNYVNNSTNIWVRVAWSGTSW